MPNFLEHAGTIERPEQSGCTVVCYTGQHVGAYRTTPESVPPPLCEMTPPMVEETTRQVETDGTQEPANDVTQPA
jgi:hypothetical protein